MLWINKTVIENYAMDKLDSYCLITAAVDESHVYSNLQISIEVCEHHEIKHNKQQELFSMHSPCLVHMCKLFFLPVAGCRQTPKADLIKMDIIKKVSWISSYYT